MELYLVTADGAWGSGAFRYDVRGDIVQKTLESSVTDYVYNGLRLAEQPTRLRILWGESPLTVSCPKRTVSLSTARGGNKPR
jgi:hypothetical protein